MPRVDVDLKLDFKDVLFRPKRSSLKSRSEVSAANQLNLDMHASVRQQEGPTCSPRTRTQASVLGDVTQTGRLLAYTWKMGAANVISNDIELIFLNHHHYYRRANRAKAFNAEASACVFIVSQ